MNHVLETRSFISLFSYFISAPVLDDFHNTLKSTKSHLTTEAATSLANVSDPASGSSGHSHGRIMGPPPPISGSPPHHNYSNIQHPLQKPISNGGSLTSSRTQSSNASPALAESPHPQPPNIPPPPIPGHDEGNFTKPRSEESWFKREPSMNAEEVRKSKLADVQDLIHLKPPLGEDQVLRTLQARFFNKKYFVSLRN